MGLFVLRPRNIFYLSTCYRTGQPDTKFGSTRTRRRRRGPSGAGQDRLEGDSSRRVPRAPAREGQTSRFRGGPADGSRGGRSVEDMPPRSVVSRKCCVRHLNPGGICVIRASESVRDFVVVIYCGIGHRYSGVGLWSVQARREFGLRDRFHVSHPGPVWYSGVVPGRPSETSVSASREPKHTGFG